MVLQINDKKYQRQLQGIERWRTAYHLGISHTNGVGTLHWVTGMGKTFAACDVANKILNRNNACTVYVIVPGDELEKQWKGAIKSFVPLNLQNNFTVITVHKAVDLLYVPECTLVIYDEVHEYLTDERVKLLNGEKLKAKFKLGLTATWFDIHGRHKLIEGIIPVIDTIDEEEASREGYISKYVEYNLGINLTNEEYVKYRELSNIINKHLNKFGKNALQAAGNCLSGANGYTGFQICSMFASSKGWSSRMDLTDIKNQEIYEQWNPKVIMGYAARLMEAVKERKDVLYNAVNKITAAKEVVIKFNDLKTICFSQSTNFADRLCWTINQCEKLLNPQAKDICVSYHSNIPTRIVYDEIKKKEVKKGKTVLKREAIEAIKSGKARVISTASSLDRGFDVKDIRLSITTSGTQNPTQHIQRKGRATRVEDDAPDAIVLIINVYIKSSQDETWLRKRQSKSNNIVYWVDKVEDINYIPKRTDVFNINEF